MRDWMDVPEAAGPQSETADFSSTEFASPGWRIGPVYPPAGSAWTGKPGIGADPARAAIERTIEAERQADLGKQVPDDALDLTVPVVPALASEPKRRPHRRTKPLEPDAEPAADKAEPEPGSPEKETVS